MSAVVRIVGIEGRRLIVKEGREVLEGLGVGSKSVVRNVYMIDVAEAAYIVFSGAAELIDENGAPISLEDLFSKYSRSKYDWIKFTVLLDLRTRGRRARSGYSENTLILERNGDRKMIFVAEENSPIKSGKLIEWAEDAVRKGYDPVIALVDANGDVTYYTMRVQRVEDLRGVQRQ